MYTVEVGRSLSVPAASCRPGAAPEASRSLAAERRDAPPQCSAHLGGLPGRGAPEGPAGHREAAAFGPAAVAAASFVAVVAVYPEEDHLHLSLLKVISLQPQPNIYFPLLPLSYFARRNQI